MPFFELLCDGVVIAFDGLEGVLGDAPLNEVGRGAEEGVSVSDVSVEEREWSSRLEGLHPEADLAQLDGHGVEVHAVDAASDDVAQGALHVWGAGFEAVAADLGESVGGAACGGDEEVSRAAGGVHDGQGQEGVFGGWGLASAVKDGFEGGVEEAIDERRGGVVAAGGLAVVAGGVFEAQGGDGGADLGDALHEGLVDAAEFVGLDAGPVDGAADVAVLDDAEGFEGVKEVLVGQGGGGEVWEGVLAPQEAPQGGQGEVCAALVEQVHDEAQGQPRVLVWGARAFDGEVSQPAGGVEVEVAALGVAGCVGVEQQASVLGDEQKQEAVDQAQELAVEVLGGQGALGQALAQGEVVPVGEEARAQVF